MFGRLSNGGPRSRPWSLVTGLAASLGYLGLLVLPYPLISTPAVSVYYTRGTFGVQMLLLVGLFTVVVFAGGVAGRLKPGLLSGLLVGFGLSLAVLTWTWAVSVPSTIVMGMPTVAAFSFHRWALSLLATVVAVVSVWYGYQLLTSQPEESASVSV